MVCVGDSDIHCGDTFLFAERIFSVKCVLAFAFVVLMMSQAVMADSLRVTMASRNSDVHLKNSAYSGWTGSTDYAAKVGRESGQAYNYYTWFDNITLPANAVIDSAFQWGWGYADDNGACTLTIHGEADDDAATYPNTTSDIGSRVKTTDSVTFAPGQYDTPAGVHLGNWAVLVQEIYDTPGWTSGNAMAFQIANGKASSGDGLRYLRTYDYFIDGGGTPAPVLVIYYHIEASTPKGKRRQLMQMSELEQFPVWGQWEMVL